MKSGCCQINVLIVSMLGAPLPAETWAVDSSPADADTLEEVIVTAQRRAERVLDVPASIGVISAADIERLHATSLADLNAATPGFLVVPLGSPGQAAIVVRGFWGAPTGAGGSMVMTLIDDAPVGSSVSSPYSDLDMLPYDIERIEILRGPQGTLYGSNSMGGVVKYVTRDPNLTAYEAQVGGEVFGIEHGGSVGTGVRGTWSAPLIDGTLAVRGSVYDKETPGYMKNPWRGINHENALSQYGGRVAMLWQPAPQLQVRLQGIYQRLSSDGNALTFSEALGTPQDPYYRPGNGLYGDLTYPHPLAEPFSSHVTLISATLEWHAAFGELVVVSSYSDNGSSSTQDYTGTTLVPLPVRQRSDAGTKRFSQELRLASPSGQRLEWVVGAYFSNENSFSDQYQDVFDSQLQLIPALNPYFIAHTPSTYTEASLFGTLTYPITDRFDLTAGLRWLTNRQKIESDTPPSYSAPASYSVSRFQESPDSYAFGARFRPQPEVMVYARVANGYRPGTANQAVPGYPEIPPYTNSDTVVNYEVGVKAELINRKVTLDLAAFKMNWNDMQVGVSSPDGRYCCYAINAGRVTSEGLEFAATYWTGDVFHLAVNAAYTDTFATEAVPGSSILVGTRLPVSPRWTGAAMVDYRLPHFGQWTAQVSGTWRHLSQQYSTLSTAPPVGLLPAYSWLDLGLRMTRGRYDVALYAKNLLDKRTFTYGLPGPGEHGEFTFFGTPLEPRVVGLSATMTL
jgi:iron complex outermembrane recepter protein